MRKTVRKIVGLGCVLVMLGSGAVSARTSYDITYPSGGAALLVEKRSDFESAVIGTDWVLSQNSDKTAIEGATGEIVTGDAPEPGYGDCLKLTSTGNAFYAFRIMQENQNTAKDAPTGGKVLEGFENAKLLTGRSTDTLRVSALVKTENLAEGVLPYLMVSFKIASSSYKLYDFTSKPFDTNGEWKEIDCVYTVPDYIAAKPRNYQLQLHLPGAGTVYMDHVRIWTDDFNYYYDDQTSASTLSKLTAGTINALYEPIDSAHAVGDTVRMITCLYETVGNAKRLVSVSPIVSTTKVADTPIQLKTTTVVTAEQAKEGASLETFFLNTGIGPVAGCEKISY